MAATHTGAPSLTTTHASASLRRDETPRRLAVWHAIGEEIPNDRERIKLYFSVNNGFWPISHRPIKTHHNDARTDTLHDVFQRPTRRGYCRER